MLRLSRRRGRRSNNELEPRAPVVKDRGFFYGLDMAISHKPIVLYRASIERMNAAHRAFGDRDYVLAAYLSGVAVECILQAMASNAGAAQDARHDLGLWLAKCPASFGNQVKGPIRSEWSLLVSLWDNSLRYLSSDGMIGYYRRKRATYGISGNPLAIMREITRQIVQSSDMIHKRGVAVCKNSIEKS
jgi:hypothetical protein